MGSGEYITATGATVVVEGSSSNAGSQTPEASGQESQPAQDAESDSQKNPDSLQPANPDGTKQDVTAPNEETFPWWLVGVAVAAIAVVVLAVVFKKKNQA